MRTYERLSAQDASFLMFEGPNTPMNVGGAMIFETGPLATADGGVDIQRVRRLIEARLNPRYRQRLAYSPVTGHPVWVDDERFNIHYHVKHTSLPRPGTDEQLKELTARILAQPLDRRRPMWETWIVEGFHDGRFAMVTKTHHCAVDGVTGVDLVASLMALTPDAPATDEPDWSPRRTPSGLELIGAEVAHRAKQGWALSNTLRDALNQPRRAIGEIGGSLAAAWEMLNAGIRGAPETPFNQSIGPHRRFDWLSLRLDDVKLVKNRLGGTVNDVVLATVAGAVGTFLDGRLHDTATDDFRALVPVNMRTPAERNIGNHVSAWLTSLPIREPDPLRRFASVQRMTQHLKETKQASTAELLGQVMEWADSLLALSVGLATRAHPYNLVVTNVAGPPFPMFLLGSRMLAGYPQVPLFEKQGLGVALFSYDGNMFWGFNGDWDLMPDLSSFAQAVQFAFHELHAAAMAATIQIGRAGGRAGERVSRRRGKGARPQGERGKVTAARARGQTDAAARRIER